MNEIVDRPKLLGWLIIPRWIAALVIFGLVVVSQFARVLPNDSTIAVATRLVLTTFALGVVPGAIVIASSPASAMAAST